MAGEIATAFVRIQPNTSTFKAETESGVKKALVSVGKITAGFFALKGISDEVKAIAGAATAQQSTFAVLGKTIENAGAATRVFGKDIETLIQQQARLSGFSENDLAQSFGKFVSSTHDSRQSLKLLGDAEDVARGRHIDLSTATRVLDRAQQGSYTSLARLGIVIPKVTTEQDKLRAQRERLIEQGVKFTGSVEAAYKAQLAAAKAADAQGQRVEALRLVQEKFGGSAATFAATAEGGFARFGVAVHELEVSLGKALLPTLGDAAEGLTHFVDQLRESDDVQNTAVATVHFVRDAFGDLKATVLTLEPVLRPVVQTLADLGKFAGFGGIAAAVVAFKAVGPAIALAATARETYAKAVAAAAPAEEQAAAAQKAQQAAVAQGTPALVSHADAVETDAAANARAAGAVDLYTASLRANTGALAANTGAGRAQRTVAGTAGVAAIGPGIQEVSAASQGAEALRELGAAAEAEKPSVIAATGSLGDLAVGIEATTTVAKEGANALSEHAKAGVAVAQASRAAATPVVAQAAATEAAATAQAAATTQLASSAAIGSASLRQLGEATQQTGTSAFQAQADVGSLASTVHHSTEVIDRAGRSATAHSTALKASAAATVESTAAAGANVAAQEAEAAAYQASAVAASESAAAATVATTRTAALAATGVRAGSALAGVGRGLLAFVGGVPTIVAAALGLTAFAIFKLVTADSALESANKRLGSSFSTLAGDLKSASDAAEAYRAATSQLQTDRLSVAQANLAVQQAKTALAQSDAAAGSLAYQQQVQDVATALDQQRLAEIRVNDTEKAIEEQRVARRQAERKAAEDRIATSNALLDVVREISKESTRASDLGAEEARRRGSQRAFATGPLAGPSAAAIAAGRETPEAAAKFVDATREAAKKQAEEGHAQIARQLRDLADLAEATKRIPSQKVIEIFVKSRTPVASGIAAQINAAVAQAGPRGAGIADTLAREREEFQKNDPAIAKRISLLQTLQQATGHLRPAVVDFILRSNVEDGVRRVFAVLDRARISLRAFQGGLSAQANALKASDPDLARRILILERLSVVLGRVPTRREVELVLKAPTLTDAVAIIDKSLAGMDDVAREHGFSSGKALVAAFNQAVTSGSPFIASGLGAEVEKGLATAVTSATLAAKAVKGIRDQYATARSDVAAARQGVDEARQGLADAQDRVVEAQKGVANAIRDGNKQIEDAVNAAGANLQSIGESLADKIGQFLDAQGQGAAATPTSGPLARRLRHLEDLIQQGRASPELIKEATKLEAEINAAAQKGGGADEDRKARVKRRIEDLTDNFNQGRISVATFAKRIAALLKSEGFSYKQAGKLLGINFADGFRAEVQGILAQARAAGAGPRRAGLGAFGVSGSIVKPAEVVDTVAENIATAQKQVAQASLEQIKSAKALAAKEATLGRLNTKADHLKTVLDTANVHAKVTATQSKATTELLAKLLGRINTAILAPRPLPGAASQAFPRGGAGLNAQLTPLFRSGLGVREGTPAARRAGAAIVTDFERAGGRLGAGVEAALRQGMRAAFIRLAKQLGIRVSGFAGGGLVGGVSSGSDSVLAALSPGEAVFTADGQRMIDAMAGGGTVAHVLAKQRPHFAGGGVRSTPASAAPLSERQRGAILAETTAQTNVLRRIEQHSERQATTLAAVEAQLRGRRRAQRVAGTREAHEARLVGGHNLI